MSAVCLGSLSASEAGWSIPGHVASQRTVYANQSDFAPLGTVSVLHAPYLLDCHCTALELHPVRVCMHARALVEMRERRPGRGARGRGVCVVVGQGPGRGRGGGGEGAPLPPGL